MSTQVIDRTSEIEEVTNLALALEYGICLDDTDFVRATNASLELIAREAQFEADFARALEISNADTLAKEDQDTEEAIARVAAVQAVAEAQAVEEAIARVAALQAAAEAQFEADVAIALEISKAESLADEEDDDEEEYLV